MEGHVAVLHPARATVLPPPLPSRRSLPRRRPPPGLPRRRCSAAPRTPPPHTALTLEFTCPGGTGAANSATSSGDDPAGCHFGLSASGGASKRAAVQPVAGGDRRQRRMIKNRESAARSRARKQACTNEMELELAQLRRENRMLIQREQDFINVRTHSQIHTRYFSLCHLITPTSFISC